MGLPLFYAPDEGIDHEKAQIDLSGGDAKHLLRSLRAKQGDIVCLGDSKGTVYSTRILSITPESATCKILESDYLSPERPQVVVFQAMPKNQAMDEVVARAAESGAARVVPFMSRRSPVEAVRKAGSRLERWRTIARESSKTARRPWPLEVREPLADFIDKKLLESVSSCVILWEEEEVRRFESALPEHPPRSIGLVVGPEGGFDSGEVDLIRSMGATSASIGRLNVRAESAASYASMLVRYHYGLLIPKGRLLDE